jgi:hypothetical protein
MIHQQKGNPMTTIDIPITLAKARSALAGIDQLLTAKGWERAAVVYAFTRDGQGDNQHRPKRADALSFTAFAQLGIRGLTKRHVVAEYHRIWANAVEDGHAQPCAPGEQVKLPTIEYPGRQDAAGKKRYTEQNPSSFARHINTLPPDQRDTFVEAMTDDLSVDAVDAIVERTVTKAPVTAKAIKNMARKDPRALADAVLSAGPGASDQAFHELKLRRAGVDTSTANKKAANAWAHQQAEPILQALANVDVELCIAALNDATQHLQTALSAGALNRENSDRINAAHETFRFALTEALFHLS